MDLGEELLQEEPRVASQITGSSHHSANDRPPTIHTTMLVAVGFTDSGRIYVGLKL